MLATAAKLALVATLLVLFAPSTDAQQSVHPRCAKVKDKVQCTWLLRNGGQFERMPGATRYKIYLRTDDSDRYIACMRRNGRPNG